MIARESWLDVALAPTRLVLAMRSTLEELAAYPEPIVIQSHRSQFSSIQTASCSARNP